MMCAVWLSVAVGLGSTATGDPLATSRVWSAEHAAHLLRRAGFGGTPEEIEHLTKLGRQAAVAYLVDYEELPEPDVPVHVEPHPLPLRLTHPDADQAELQRLRMARRRADQRQMRRVIRWWIETMARTPRPLEEKLVLFWHGHFTSGYREVRSSRGMYIQNQLFRRYACGGLRDLLIHITHDPAMILYLNTRQNHKGKPNENYARELMELFTLGTGHYTEQDIKQAARALTGIGVNPRTGEALFRRGMHDFGEKMFLGRRGDFDAEEIIDIILKQPACAEFIARRLWSFFAYENPEEEVIKALARVLRENNYELKPLLRAMFTCDAFYSKRARFTHVKSPVELLVGTMHLLAIEPIDTESMNTALRLMGQQLMQPPNVKGWDGGWVWITTSTLYNRYNAVGALIGGTDTPQTRRQRRRMQRQLMEDRAAGAGARDGKGAAMGGAAMDGAPAATGGPMAMQGKDDLPPLQPVYDPIPLVQAAGVRTPRGVVDHFVRRLLQRRITKKRRDVLIEVLRRETDVRKLHLPSSAPGIRKLIHLIVSMPEYQLS